MRVAIDARPAVSPTKTGVGYYTWHLIRHLPRVDPDTTYLAWYLSSRRLLGRPLRFGDIHEPNFAERWTPYPPRLWWRLGDVDGFPRVEWFVRFDVFLATNFVPPPTRTRRLVVTVHDLAFRLFPETAPRITAPWLRRIEHTVGRAARLLVPSESTKRDLVELYPVDPDRVTVTHLGVDPPAAGVRTGREVEALRARFGIDRPYLLWVGGIEPRKNLARVVDAFGELREDVCLVIAGSPALSDPRGWGVIRPALEALPPEARRRVTLTGYVSEPQKAALLSESLGLVYPSLYEGFGLPVLEALARGTPVLTSKVSSLPEVAGDAALLVDPTETEAIREGMRRLVVDEGLRRRLAEAGPARAARFTWEETARKTAQALRLAGVEPSPC